VVVELRGLVVDELDDDVDVVELVEEGPDELVADDVGGGLEEVVVVDSGGGAVGIVVVCDVVSVVVSGVVRARRACCDAGSGRTSR
jgi:hypothetical protein